MNEYGVVITVLLSNGLLVNNYLLINFFFIDDLRSANNIIKKREGCRVLHLLFLYFSFSF